MRRQGTPDPGHRLKASSGRSLVSLVLAVPVLALGLTIVPPPDDAGAQTLLAGTALVTNWGSNTVTPINTKTNAPGAVIHVGSEPDAIAITPNGLTAYVANWGSNSVTPIDLSTGTPGKAITVGLHPDAIAITPDGTTAYVANFGSNSVTPIDIAKDTAGNPIGIDTAVTKGATHPDAIAVAPSGELVYVTSQNLGNAVEISVGANKVYSRVTVNADPTGFAFSPGGDTAYVTNLSSDTVTPINIADNAAEIPIAAGSFPRAIAVSPDGSTAYVSDFDGNSVTPINTAKASAGTPITVGASPMGIAVTPDGSTVYVADSGSNTVTPIATATSTAGTPITVGTAPDAIAVTPGWTDQSSVAWTEPNPGSAATTYGPALSYLGGVLYAVWVDKTTGDLLEYSSFNGSSWAPAQPVAGVWGEALTNQAPSMVTEGSQLLLVWKGHGSASDIYYSTFNGSAWAAQVRLSWAAGQYASTLDAPAVTLQIGDPYVAWTGGNDEIEISWETGVNKWSAPIQAKGKGGAVIHTTLRPALAYFADPGNLVVGWTNTNGTIGYVPLDDPAAQGVIPSASTGAGPAFTVMNQAVYVAWETKTTHKIGYSSTWPNFTGWGGWVPQEFEPQALTNVTPALAVTGYTLTVGWKGLSTDDLAFASANTPY